MNTNLPDGRYRKRKPHVRGWWRWMESRHRETQNLLIVGGGSHFEVAEDSTLATALKIPYNGTSLDCNYYEMTDVKTMDGLWRFIKMEPSLRA